MHAQLNFYFTHVVCKRVHRLAFMHLYAKSMVFLSRCDTLYWTHMKWTCTEALSLITRTNRARSQFRKWYFLCLLHSFAKTFLCSLLSLTCFRFSVYLKYNNYNFVSIIFNLFLFFCRWMRISCNAPFQSSCVDEFKIIKLWHKLSIESAQGENRKENNNNNESSINRSYDRLKATNALVFLLCIKIH